MIERERLIELMSGVHARVDSRMRSQVAEILQLCEKDRYLAEKFTFDKDEELDKQVNQMLIRMTDLILADTYALLDEVLEDEEDKQKLIAYATRSINGMDATQRLDSYGSHLKYLLEGWLAIGFYNKLSINEIESKLFAYMKYPFASMDWKEAFRQGTFDAQIIQEGGFTYGRGVASSPVEGVTLTTQYMLSEAYQMGMIEGYKRMGAIGYRVFRGSTYDCPTCDALCVGIHPVDDICLPAHPRCMCWTKPVYLEDIKNG